MKKLEDSIGYSFADKSLLETALTHSSRANEQRASGVVSNERLEFLGDSILGMIVAEHLFRDDSNMPEGEMTRRRAELVCEKSLAAAAVRISLGDFLLLGKGEQAGGGSERPSILSDAFEAILAAVYLDGGKAPVVKIVNNLILSEGERIRALTGDHKTELQELVQKRGGQTLSYRLTGESGPDHAKIFAVDVLLNGEKIGSGEGRSKKEAEQAAACQALGRISK